MARLSARTLVAFLCSGLLILAACAKGAGPSAASPAAPSDVRVAGVIPDLSQPVPPGQGEEGRVTLEWRDNSGDETGFRLYSEECGHPVEAVASLPPNTTSYGPLNPCRPARLGVAAFNGAGESAIAWATSG